MSFKEFAAKEFTVTHGAPAAGEPGGKAKDAPATQAGTVPNTPAPAPKA